MANRRSTCFTALILFISFSSMLHAQVINSINLSIKEDSLQRQNSIQPVKENVKVTPDLLNTLIVDFYTTCNGIQVKNSQEANQQNSVFWYYNLTLNNTLKIKRVSLRTYFFSEYGIRYYLDSTKDKTDDKYSFKNTLQIPINEVFKAQLSYNINSQFFKTFNRREDDSGMLYRYLYTDYFSPGYFVFSGGITLCFLEDGTIDIGVVGGKTTKVKNQKIFDERRSDQLYGLERGERKKLEYGVSLQINLPPHKFGKHLGWELNANTFANKDQLGRLKSYTGDVNNAVHYIFLKYMRLSLRTRLIYDETVQQKIFVMNQLSIGFYLSNSL